MRDSQAKSAWEAANVIKVLVKVNRNQNPELYEVLSKADSKSGLARDLMSKGIKNQKNEQ